jgi:hypothetical protein
MKCENCKEREAERGDVCSECKKQQKHDECGITNPRSNMRCVLPRSHEGMHFDGEDAF